MKVMVATKLLRAYRNCDMIEGQLTEALTSSEDDDQPTLDLTAAQAAIISVREEIKALQVDED